MKKNSEKSQISWSENPSEKVGNMGLTRALLLFSSISTNMVSSLICVLMMSLSLSLYFSSYLKVPLLSPIFTASLQQIEFLMKFSVVKMPLFVVFFLLVKLSIGKPLFCF